MPLTTDRGIRDFAKTPESAGRVRRSSRGSIFVVQKHDASRLHYDFRLATNGVLVFWAVPKGPSMNPGDKRLAVRTEDHPLEYAKFEGVIPPGQYGAGTVMVWDLGEYESPENQPLEEQLAHGMIHIALQGKAARRLRVGQNRTTILKVQAKRLLVADQKSRRVRRCLTGHREP
jgi:bifunctional non-homologous end joining protein LigD